jgi:hypothetical protein
MGCPGDVRGLQYLQRANQQNNSQYESKLQIFRWNPPTMPPVAVPVKRVGIPIGTSLHFQRLSLFDSLQGYGMSFLIDAAEISSREETH